MNKINVLIFTVLTLCLLAGCSAAKAPNRFSAKNPGSSLTRPETVTQFKEGFNKLTTGDKIVEFGIQSSSDPKICSFQAVDSNGTFIFISTDAKTSKIQKISIGTHTLDSTTGMPDNDFSERVQTTAYMLNPKDDAPKLLDSLGLNDAMYSHDASADVNDVHYTFSDIPPSSSDPGIAVAIITFSKDSTRTIS